MRGFLVRGAPNWKSVISDPSIMRLDPVPQNCSGQVPKHVLYLVHVTNPLNFG